MIRRTWSGDGSEGRFERLANDRLLSRGCLRADEQLRGDRQVLRGRGHRVVFIVEESFAGTLEAKGFEERLMRLGPPPAEPRSRASSGSTSSATPRRSSQEHVRTDQRVHRPDVAGAGRRREVRQPPARGDHRRGRAGRDRRGQRRPFPAVMSAGRPWSGSCPATRPSSRTRGAPFSSGYPADDVGVAGVPRGVPPRACRDVGRLRRVLSRARRRWPGRRGAGPEFMHESPYLNLYSTLPKPTTSGDALGPTWHRLDSSVRAPRRPGTCPTTSRAPGALIYLSLG